MAEELQSTDSELPNLAYQTFTGLAERLEAISGDTLSKGEIVRGVLYCTVSIGALGISLESIKFLQSHPNLVKSAQEFGQSIISDTISIVRDREVVGADLQELLVQVNSNIDLQTHRNRLLELVQGDPTLDQLRGAMSRTRELQRQILLEEVSKTEGLIQENS